MAIRTRWVELAEHHMRLRVLEAGEGQPLLLLHGLSSTADTWTPLMAALPGRRLLALDLPDLGQVAAGELRGAAVSVLEGVLDALWLNRLPVAGSGLGGLWAFWLALDRPERVAALAQYGAPLGVPGQRVPLLMRLRAVAGGPGLARRVLRLGGDGLRSEARIGLPELGQIHRPTLLYWGERDPLGRTELARRVAGALSRAELALVPGGRTPWRHDPAGAARALDRFLTVRAAERQWTQTGK